MSHAFVETLSVRPTQVSFGMRSSRLGEVGDDSVPAGRACEYQAASSDVRFLKLLVKAQFIFQAASPHRFEDVSHAGWH